MTRLNFVIIVIVCIAMFLGIAFAQDDALTGGTVRGQITDLTPAQSPIEGVQVKIVARDGGKEFITKTDADGNYKHSGLPAGRYSIRISKEGYGERAGRPVTVVKGGDHFVPLKMTEKGRIVPFFEVPPAEKMNIITKQRIVSLLERVAESIGKRYNLDEADVKAFHRSILDSIEGALEQGGDLNVFAKPVEEGNMSLLEMLLSHPVCQVVIAKHLSEAQLQDYLEFTEARRQRDRQAVVHWITVAFDKELSLRTDQRGKVVQLLLDTTENELFPTSMNALRLSSQRAAQLAHYKLKVSLDGVLSEAQSKVWQGLVEANANSGFVVILKRPQPEIKDAVDVDREKVNIVIDGIDIREQHPWNEVNPVESQEQMVETAEAKLASHTELLGALDERAARRLALVAKGVSQQYFEAHDEAREAISTELEADLMKKVEDGKMTREEAAAMLDFTVKNAMDELWGDGGSKIDITSQPLYQQTIKDVLSEEAFARYSAHRAERETLRQQVLRDMVVACMDTQLLLDDPQREQLETVALRLLPAPFSTAKPAELMFFQLFPQTVDFEALTPWQQGEFERVFGPIIWGR